MTTHGTFSFPSATTGDVDRFIYDGPVQSGATLPASAGTTRNICHDTNGGNSTNVGPDQGQEGVGGGYLYTELSSPGANGDQFYIEFDTVLDASAEQWQFNFYNLQRGPAIGNNQSTVQVQISEGGGAFADVGALFGGAGQDTTDGTAWTSRSVDLSNGGLNVHATTRVRLEITTVAATAWHGDMGIDTILIVGTATAAREQDSFRFEDDDGSESGSTFLAAQNVDISRGKEDPFRVRVGMQATGDPPAEKGTIQVKETGDAATEWRDV